MAVEHAPTLAFQLQEFHRGFPTMVPSSVFDAITEDREALVRAHAGAGAVTEGDPAPDFTLPDAAGNPVQLSSLLARGPVALAFYRGEWCPYCNLALRAYQAILPEIAALGATFVAVSPQTPDHTVATAEKLSLSFPVLSDAGNAVARRYGLGFTLSEAVRPALASIGVDLPRCNGDPSWELPIPGTFVIAPDGRVRLAFVDPDFTLRLEPATLLDALRAAAARRP